MKSGPLIASFFSLLLFFAGILLEIAISAVVLWGKLEARFYLPSSVNSGLPLKCPHILSFDETGTISVSIINTQNKDAQPIVTAQVSRNNGAQQMSQTVTLAPHESRTVQWNVDASNILFGRLILVSVLQGKDGELAAQQGYCGILFLNLLGMSGQEAFALLCFTGLALLILDAVIWRRTHLPLNVRDASIARALSSLAVLGTLGLLSAILRWWGFILILETMTVIAMFVVFTDVLFNPQPRRT